jgi:endonuclease YncB( thermonuclease family)
VNQQGHGMPLTLIAGQYRIVGAAPDGDSVRFYPTAADAFTRAGINARTNASGGAQMRLDGIDALETHYTPSQGGAGTLHQPAEFGDAAAARLLDLLGFSGVQRNDRQVVTSAGPDAVDGYILTRFADQYGRCVSFLFTGAPPGEDLSQLFLTPEQVRTSVNVSLLADGMAYPTYYSKLFPDLRAVMTEAVRAARSAGSGLWPTDVTSAGFTVTGEATITTDVVIMPKLFRRLADYLALNDGASSLAGLPTFLAAQDDRLVVISEGRFTGFDNVIEVTGQQVKLLYPPEDLVFMEK